MQCSPPASSAFTALMVPAVALSLIGSHAAASQSTCAAGSACASSEDFGEAVHLLQQGRQSRSPKQRRLDSNETLPLGVVHAMYTFGAPAASSPAFPNLQAKDGCFNGLRTFTENIMAGGGRQVDAASIIIPYPHAKVAVLALHWNEDSFYEPCRKEDYTALKWPLGGVSLWDLHHEKHYAPRLKSVQLKGKPVASQEPFATANKMVTLAYKSYDSVAHTKAEIAKSLPTWQLVEHRVYENFEGYYDTDALMVVQEKETLECALVFTGTDTFGEFGTSINQYFTGYCGFDKVHVGYRDELWTLTDATIWPRVTKKLSKCSKVTCVGHSLGGALCDVFSACANSHRVKDPDYQRLMWYQETPKLMSEIGAANVTLGTVSALYTYGAPGTAYPSLDNLQSSNGCFAGIRAYTEDDMAGGGKQVDAYAFSNNYFPHAKMNTLSLQWSHESYFASCGEGDSANWPKHTGISYDNWGMHSEKDYTDRLNKLMQSHPIESYLRGYSTSASFAALALGATKSKPSELKALVHKALPGWRLVGRSFLADPAEPALLVQGTSLNCALVLPGEAASRDQTYGTGFCGRDNVHAGYRNHLVKIVETLGWINVTQKMAQCKKVICVGHGQAGALCELFAYCVNSQRQEDADYRRLGWIPKTPTALPEVSD